MTDTKILSPNKFVALKVKQKNVIKQIWIVQCSLFVTILFICIFTIVYCEVQYGLVLRKRVSKKKET